jgi:hypothetical protein
MDLELKSAVEGIFVCPDCGKFHYEKDGSVVSDKYCFICEKKKTKKAYIMPVTKDADEEDAGKELQDGDTIEVAQVCEECMRSVFGMSAFDIKGVKTEDEVIRKIIREKELAAESEDSGEEEYFGEDILSLFGARHDREDTVVYRDFEMDGVFKDMFKKMKDK